MAIVTGRRIEDLDRVLAPLVLPASGIHGAQIRRAPAAPIDESGAIDVPLTLADAVRAVVAGHPGAFVEDKGRALAVHWRATVERAESIGAELIAALEASDTPDFVILRGHCVFEIKSANANKGEAVRAFMQFAPFAGRTPIFVGDDVTDISGFRAVKDFGGLAYSVGHRLEGADAVFEDPSAVRAWLAGLVDRQAAPHPVYAARA